MGNKVAERTVVEEQTVVEECIGYHTVVGCLAFDWFAVVELELPGCTMEGCSRYFGK